MATYLDGMEGGKHNSDIEVSTNGSFKVSLTFEGVDAKNPLKAVKSIIEQLRTSEFIEDMVFDVVDEETEQKFTVCLSDDIQVLENNE